MSNLTKVIQKLLKERTKLDGIIVCLEQMKISAAELQHKPPKKRRGRKSMDAEQRKEVSERMKKYWAMRKDGRRTV
jgi:hypothetical protein